MDRGFSIIELLISVSILIFINTLILTSYPKFVEMVNLNQASQVIASSIRRAQVYGMTIKEEAGVGGFPSYGIYFEKASPSIYILFVDLNNNNQYNEFSGELLETYSIPLSISIDNLCREEKTSSFCGDLEELHIVFKRPMPTIFLYGKIMGPFDDVEIKLKSPRGREKSITVWKTGQISVE